MILNTKITFIAYLTDMIFAEFKYIKHPVVFMGDYIKWFEKHFYQNNIKNGIYLTISLITIVFTLVYILLSFISNDYILGLIASTGIASKMLYQSVNDIILNPQNIKYLVSRDTQNLSQSDINKAAIETYAENLSDAVIAPIFYLLIFGLYGLFIYKAINTLDSMVGYRNNRYEKFGKFSARVDDIANFIPARITAIMICILYLDFKAITKSFYYGKKHKSINAGYPISAMALVLDISLGGDTSYFGKIEKKAYFGEGRKDITTNDIFQALQFKRRFDILIISILSLGFFI